MLARKQSSLNIQNSDSFWFVGNKPNDWILPFKSFQDNFFHPIPDFLLLVLTAMKDDLQTAWLLVERIWSETERESLILVKLHEHLKYLLELGIYLRIHLTSCWRWVPRKECDLKWADACETDAEQCMCQRITWKMLLSSILNCKLPV